MSSHMFFLGGYDAEMIEIKQILQDRNLPLSDHRLSWGASLSSYKDQVAGLPEDVIPVFIELHLDCPYPERAVIIDHHNEHAGRDRRTSIEQIADMLGIEPTRRQQLISANDKGHIRAMQSMGASESEIRAIRSLDRKAQGVTGRDEELAEASIKNHLKAAGHGAVIIKSLTNKTSAIVDRIHDRFDAIFIHTPDGRMHYNGRGRIVYRLAGIFEEKSKANPSLDFWWGGDLPDFGFFGADSPLDDRCILKIIQE